MNRHAFQAALGRGSSRSSTSSLSTPTAQYFQTIHAAPGAARSFSSTATRPDSDSSDKPPSDNSNNSTPSPNRNGRERSEAAAQKLASLSRRYSNSNGPSSSSDRPFTPRRGGNFDGNNSSNFRGNFRGNNAREGGIIDARSLRSAPAPSSSGSGDALAAPRIINIRSIRGGAGFRGRGGGRFAGRGGASASADGGRPPRFANAGPGRGGFGTSFRGGAAGARTGGFGAGAGGPGARFAGPGRSGARGRGARGRGDGAGGRGGRREGKKDEEERKGTGGKMVFLPEEQAVIDRMEKGVVVPFNPDVTYQSLSGYGAAIATDAPLGQVETAIRAMRAMTGGMAFNADSGVTADITAIMKRHDKKQPIFVHSKEEKAWIEAAKPKHMLSEPTPDIKKAIVDAAILGKHETPKFAEVGDTQAVMANYHGRTFTYRASDSQRFMDKVLALMPKPAAQASKRA